MKKLKFIIPILAFVIAITVAFAVPAKVTDTTEVPTIQGLKAWYEDPFTWECLECELFQYDCDVNNTGTICTCYVFYENGEVWDFFARNDPNDSYPSRRCMPLYRPYWSSN